MVNMNKSDWLEVLNAVNDGISFYDIIAIIISVASLIITILSLLMQRRQNITNLQATYFEEIFKKYFMKKIPQKLTMLSFNKNGQLCKSYREIIDVFLDMIIDSAYFAYAKKDFYDKLKNEVTNLEDKLIDKAGDVVLEKVEQNEFIYSIHEDTKSIVKLVNKNYHRF